MSELTDRMVELARDLRSQSDPTSTLQHVIDSCRDLIEPAESVGISLARGRRKIETAAASDPIPLACDQLQEELAEGPCLDVMWTRPLVLVQDLEAETEHWPRWAPKVIEQLGVHSMLCVSLFTNEDSLGVINLYSGQAGAFSHDDVYSIQALAAHAAVALAAASDIHNLQIAVDRRAVISRALGVIMERYLVDSDRAFAIVRRLSSEQNRKLYDVAADILTHHLNELDSRRESETTIRLQGPERS